MILNFGLLEEYIVESNKIEHITLSKEELDQHMEWYKAFLNYEYLSVDELILFVSRIQPDAQFRNHMSVPGVRVGNHFPPMSGSKVGEDLTNLLHDAETSDPWRTHVAYETLHPFTDGNGRH